MRIRDIENKAEKILQTLNIDKPPINIKEIAMELGLVVQTGDFGNEVSGVIVFKNGKGIIGYNPNDPDVRQRFTIAHEFGHYLLHKNRMEMFVDKTYYAFRDENSSKGEFKLEREANAFAAAILMPRSLLLKEIKLRNFDLAESDESLNKLAKKFRVSVQAMSFRLANLDVF